MNNTLKQIPTKVVIRRTFKKLVFGSHIHCPECKSRSVRFVRSEERWRCKRCEYPFSIKSASWLKGSKLSFENIWLLLWCWQKEFSLKHAQDLTELSYPTVSSWYERFRDHIPKDLLEKVLLSGDIVCDEMYTRKQAIIGAKEKGTRNIAMKIIHAKSVNKSDAMEFLQAFVKANSTLSTDGSGIYKGCDNWHKLKHQYEIHSKFQFSLTAEIEGLWGVFRTFIRRMYHHVTRYKLSKIVSEFCLRFRQHILFNSPYEYLSLSLKA